MHAHKALLYWLALICEVIGLGLISTSDVVPELARLWQSAKHALVGWVRSVEGLLRRLLHRPKIVEYVDHVQGDIGFSGEAASISVVIRSGTLAEKVAALIEHDQRAQERINALAKEASAERAAWREAVEQVRVDLESQIASQTQEITERNRGRRALGTLLVAIGAVLGTLGNLA